MNDGNPDPLELQGREERLADREIEMALSEAQLRGQEAHVGALGRALETRGGWIDAQVARLSRWAMAAGVDADAVLRGLGGGAAMEEADLDRYVRRSETLLLGRAAVIATRAEVLSRRQEQLAERARELEAFEQAFVRAEVRLTARERLLRDAIAQLQRSATGDAETMPDLEPAPRRASPATPPGRARHRHAPTVTMTVGEGAALDASLTQSPGEAPPVLDFDAAWQAPAPRGTLTLAGHALRRSAVEIDRSSRVVLASLDESVQLSGRIDLVGRDAQGEARCFPVRVQLVMPGSEGRGSAVVLSAAQWSDTDFDGFAQVLAALA